MNTQPSRPHGAPKSSLTLLNELAMSGDYRLTPDIAYGAGPRGGLDVYTPTEQGGGRPVAVFFYGGGWKNGHKDTCRFIGAALAERGIVTMIPDYRIYPEARFPDFVRDNAQAVRWAREHARDYGGDPEHIVLIGHSAGGYNAAMLTLDAQWLADVGLDNRRDIAGMVGLAGIYDFLPLKHPIMKDIFGPEDRPADTQPVSFAEGLSVPMLLATGDADETIDPRNTTRLAKRIRETGGPVTLSLYPGVDHRMIIRAFAPSLHGVTPIFEDTVAFVRAAKRGASA